MSSTRTSVGQSAEPHVFLAGRPPLGEYLGFDSYTKVALTFPKYGIAANEKAAAMFDAQGSRAECNNAFGTESTRRRRGGH